MKSGLGISVLIRTYNSAKTLENVLAAIQLEMGDEVLLVDSGSTDATLQIGKKHGAKIIHAPAPFNYSKSLNLGFRAARNDWVLVLSSHSLPRFTTFISTYKTVVHEFPNDIVVGYGPSTLSGDSDPMFKPSEITICSALEYPLVNQVCSNANSIYRRVAWMEYQFDESVRTSEDKLWIQEMTLRKYRFAYIPTVPTTNRNQASLVYMFKKGFSDARTLRSSSHSPMKLRHLAGALKNFAKQCLQRKIDRGNWLRRSAHAFGQFFASYLSENNAP